LLGCGVLSPRPWKLEAVLRLMIGLFLCLFVGMLVTMLTSNGKAAGAPPTLRQVVVSVICLQGASIVLIWRFVREHGISWTEGFGFRNARFRAVVLGTVTIFVFLPLGWVLQVFSLRLLEHFGLETTSQQAVQVLHSIGQGVGLITFALVTVVVAPLGEELLFRGVLYPAIKRAGFPKLALWGSSLLFAGIHLNAATFLPLLLLSLLLVWLYEQTDNLIAPLVGHALFNGINLLIFFINGDPDAKLPAQP
jgi:membrane protease YdiL (CAAX protease family)